MRSSWVMLGDSALDMPLNRLTAAEFRNAIGNDGRKRDLKWIAQITGAHPYWAKTTEH